MRPKRKQLSKECLECGTIYYAPVKYSGPQWMTRQFCSHACHRANQAAQRWSAARGRRTNDECWPWVRSDPTHYASVNIDGERVLAHRMAWTREHGDPGDLLVLHRCDNPPCVNPAHLFVGTHADNMRDMVQKGRNRNGLTGKR